MLGLGDKDDNDVDEKYETEQSTEAVSGSTEGHFVDQLATVSVH